MSRVRANILAGLFSPSPSMWMGFFVTVPRSAVSYTYHIDLIV